MMFELPAIGELCLPAIGFGAFAAQSAGHLLHKAHCLAGDYHYNCGHLSPGVYLAQIHWSMTDEALLHWEGGAFFRYYEKVLICCRNAHIPNEAIFHNT